jgi:hypothetical protein
MAERVEEDGARRGYGKEEARRSAKWNKEICWGRRSSWRASRKGEREPHHHLLELVVDRGAAPACR